MTLSFDRFIPIAVATSTQQAALLEGLQTWLNLGLIYGGQVDIQLSVQRHAGRPNTARVQVTLHPTEHDFLAGLDAWLRMGLLSQARLSVEVQVQANTLALLEGLDAWVQLDLLSQPEILQLCRSHLTCAVPAIISQPEPRPVQQPPVASDERFPMAQPSIAEWQPSPVTRPSPRPLRRRTPNNLSQILQSLVAELSVLWLLLLGVFMVVISSAVLAASQWERFPPLIQYGILWLYTLGFWGSSFWTGRQSTLRLTTQALRIITLLLVPLNFLAIDSFGLWRSPLQWLLVAIAVVSLTGLTVQIFRVRSPDTPSGRNISLFNHLGLSYIHLGWGIVGFPLLATYVGIVGTTFLNRYSRSPSLAPAPASGAPPSQPSPFSLNGAVVLYAIGIVLLRAIFIAQIPVTQLGLAIGLCGWLLIQQAPPEAAETPIQPVPQHIWDRLGGSLLFLGWLLSVATIPWQALMVSGLAVLVFAQRVLRTWSRGDLTAMLVIGLQMFWLGWRMVPDGQQQAVVAWATGLTGTEAMPIALLGIALFPYLVLLLAVFDGLIQIRRRELAQFDGWLALMFGAMLMMLSLPSPVLRTLNFGFSTLALGVVTGRQQRRNLGAERQRHLSIDTMRSLADLTHLGGLLTLFSTIDWLQPGLGLIPWAGIGLGLMLAEWGLSLGQPLSPDPDVPPTTLLALLRQSSWNLGLLLAGLAYAVLLVNLLAQAHVNYVWGHPVASPLWGGLWLIVPLTLTGLIAWIPTRRELASWLSVAALGLAQGLTLGVPDVRSLSLGIATGLMLVNTVYLQQLAVPVITVGFGLSLIGALIEQQLPKLPLVDWLLLGAIATTALWVMRHWLTRYTTQRLPALYQQACDGWAIALCGVDLLILAINPASMTLWRSQSTMVGAGTLILLMLSSAYRSWQPTRSAQVLWAGVAVLLVAQIPLITVPGARLLLLGVATILILVHTHYLETLGATALTVGLGLGVIGLCLWDGVGLWRIESLNGWLLALSITVAMLWLFQTGLLRRSTHLAVLYSQAMDGWAAGLGGLTLMGLTLHSLLINWNVTTPSPLVVGAAAITLGAITYRTWNQPTNWTLSALGWSLELLTLEVLGMTGRSIVALAIANTTLGLLTQILGDWWHRHTNRPQMLSCWHILPLIYGALGTALRWNLLTQWTGLSSLGLVLIAFGVGRRQAAFKPLLYLAVAGISLSAYELLFYQVIRLSPGDQLLAMAALTTTILYAYRILTPWLTGYLRLTSTELLIISHLHWGLGSLLLLTALFYPAELYKLVGLGAGLFLTRYAIMQGRNHPNQLAGEAWVYLGILEAIGIAEYLKFTVPTLSTLAQYLQPGAGAIAACVAVVVYLLPWRLWGWSNRPWQLAAILAPLGIVATSLLATSQSPHIVSLLVMAGFYGWVAWKQQQSRWLYISLLAINWAIGLLPPPEESTFPTACVVGLSILSITWFEPACRLERGRSLRHNLRCLGLGIIGITALIMHHQPGIISAIVGIIGIFLGLGLRIRAFLYIGTVTFLAIAFYQMVILIFAYPMLKWVIGLLIGIVFIWIAANFETHRQQFTTMLRNWLIELEEWE
jgi:hypothetical protein